MSITPDDWFDRFFGNFPFGKRGHRSYFDDMFGGFDQMRKEMERKYERSFKDFETKAPKDLIREYETAAGGKGKRNRTFRVWIFNDDWTRW